MWNRGEMAQSVIPGIPGGSTTVSGSAGQVAFFTSATALGGDTQLTWDNVTKILAATEMDIGATPFKFLETAGVLQLGDSNLTYNPVGAGVPSLYIGDPAALGDVTVPLHVLGTADGSIPGGFQMRGLSSVNSISNFLEFFGSKGDFTTPLNMSSNTSPGSINWNVWNQIDAAWNEVAEIICLVGAADGSNHSPANITFNLNGTPLVTVAENTWAPGIANGVDLGDNGSIWGRWRTGYFGTSVLGPLFGEVAASGADAAGTDVVVAGGQGTGTGAGGTLKLQTAPAGLTGSTPNALTDQIIIASDGTITIPSLAGSGSRAVVVSSSGVVSAP